MSVILTCPGCGNRGSLPPAALTGGKFRCRQCGGIVTGSPVAYEWFRVDRIEGPDRLHLVGRVRASGQGAVRLLGVTVPAEHAAPAVEFLRTQSLEREVHLEYGPPVKGQTARDRAFVYLDDNRHLNLELLREGLALPATDGDAADHREEFAAAAREAAAAGRGLHRGAPAHAALAEFVATCTGGRWDELPAQMVGGADNEVYRAVRGELARLAVRGIEVLEHYEPLAHLLVARTRWQYATPDGDGGAEVHVVLQRDGARWKVGYWEEDPARIAAYLRAQGAG